MTWTFESYEVENLCRSLEARGISAPIRKAFRAVPRHLFVSEEIRHRAYEDKPLPLGCGQTISQPFMVAWTLQQANIESCSRVLDIGTGSGFQAALASVLVKEVFTVECIPELLMRAEERFLKLGLHNIRTKCADGRLGWAEHSPYDAIVAAASPAEIPRILLTQLADGGSFVGPLGVKHQRMIIARRRGGSFLVERSLKVKYVPLI